MDIQQLRSWVFELYDPLTEERTYILLHGQDGEDGLLIDLPPFDRRLAIQIRGICDPRLVFFTHADRARDLEPWRDALIDTEFAIHEADADAVAGGVDLRLGDADLLTREPETRIVHLGARTPGASMVIASVSGGVLFTGDAVTGNANGTLSLPDPSYADPDRVRAGIEKLRGYEFSAVLSAHGRPVWSAAKERYLELLRELPRPRRRFGHLLDAPWDRAYLRVRSQMAPNPLVPTNETIAEAAGHGPSTLVTAWERKPAREVTWKEASAAALPGAPTLGDGKKWSLSKEAPRALPPKPPGPVQTFPGELAEAPVAFRGLSAEELVDVPRIDEVFRSFDLSPDGTEVVFSWDRTGSLEVYRAPVSGDAIYQLTSSASGNERSVQPRISADGRTIAFLRDAGGDERFDIWLVDRDGARERKLTDRPATRDALVWAPLGARLAYVSDESGALALHVRDVASGASRIVAGGLRPLEKLELGPSWSSDGRFLAYHSADPSNNVDLYIVPSDGSTDPRRLDTRGGAPGQSRTPRFSADDRRLAFATDARGRWEVAILPLDDGKPDGAVWFLREGHYDESDPVWEAEPRRILYRRSADAIGMVRRSYLVSLDDEPVLDAPGVHSAVKVRPDGGLVYQWSGAREPADVYVKGRDEIIPRRITRSLPPAMPAGLFVEPRHLRYPAADGTPIPALLYLPHREAASGDGGPPPAIVYAHGGPTDQHFARFDEWAQWFANRGYVVFAPNVRGSTGYGRAFREAGRGDIGGKDLGDLIAGASWLAGQGVADGRRIAVFGRSYGGYLALLALARAPDRFAAGCAIAGLTSLERFLAATRPDIAGAMRLYVEGLDANALRERSPQVLVDRITAPVLILHGRTDPRVPVAEAEQFVEALRVRGKAFSFYAYDEGHVLLRRDDRRDALERAIEFFDEHVKRKAFAVSPA